jgi:Spy/CpxP family protein refolding chaperone
MKSIRNVIARRRWAIAGSLVAGLLIAGVVYAQQPVQPTTQPQRAGAQRGGRGGIPNATPAQAAAIAQMNSDLAPLLQNLAAARKELLAVSLAVPGDGAAIKAKVEAVNAADAALAAARADSLAKIQASSSRLSPAQIAALPNLGGQARAPAAPAGAGIPNMTSNQVAMLTEMTGSVRQPVAGVNAARAELTAVAFAGTGDDAAIKAKLEQLAALELDLANTRAAALAKIQSSPNALSAEQVQALINVGGVLTSGGFSEPKPIDFNDHEGYVSMFDGVSLKGWDGNPKFWSVVDGAIVGESTQQNPSGNTYIVYRDIEAHDFTLKCEIKVEGSGGSGIQYRSKTGIPWLTAIAPNVTANVGPVNLAWMMTGPQADFWPVRVYSGQVYSENTPMRIEAWRGQVVEQSGMAGRKLMGNIGDRIELGKIVKMNDWNQYTVIARGSTVIQIINGQMMAALVDDDPTSSNNESGLFGIEMEATTRVSARNIWLKKLN